jgi:hypothetical protein
MEVYMTKVFVSYSWDNDEHKKWVAQLATRLRSDGVNVILDQWHLVPGDQLPLFMERAVRESDYVLIICTSRYKEKSDNRSGGVGYEGDIMSGEILTQNNQRKFIPILRQGAWQTSAPSWLTGKYYVDLSEKPYPENQYFDLVTTLLGTRPTPPSIINPKVTQEEPKVNIKAVQSPISEVGFEPITILGVIVDKIGTPRGDGTRGSALYDVPFRLSRRPPSDWSSLFIEAWNHPPRWTTMHRPGIASIYDDTIHLDGTTIDEVKSYHRETLILATNEANTKYIGLLEIKKRKQLQEQQRLENHKRNIDDVAKDIKF